ncbi:MAG: 50S ribosomal protein L9 [Candidatus Aminicenantia bacterium]
MKVILIENIENIGKIGDIIDVKDGYARNYLFPKKIALLATEENMKFIKKRMQEVEIKIQIEKLNIEELDRRLRELQITIKKKCGEKDVIFGSVTATDIWKALSKAGYELDKKKIHLEEPIKRLGIYTVPIKIHPSVTSEVKVEVVREE